MRARSLRGAVGLAAAMTVVACPFPEVASASCASPSLTVGSAGDAVPLLSAGGPATVSGRGFVDGCDDGGGGTVGCGAEEPEPTPPSTDIALTLRQGQREWTLGTEDAGTEEDDELGQVVWDVDVPDDVAPGRAVLEAGTSSPLVVRIRR